MINAICSLLRKYRQACTEINVPPGNVTPMEDYLERLDGTVELVDFLSDKYTHREFSFKEALSKCKKCQVLVALPMDHKRAYIIENNAQIRWYFAKNNLPRIVFKVDRLAVEYMTPGNDICVSCKIDTGIAKHVPVHERRFYVIGQGQRCERCYKEEYGE